VLPDFDRADRIGEFWGNPKTRTFAELLIDCEEDRTLRVVRVGIFCARTRAESNPGHSKPFSITKASAPELPEPLEAPY
jgi:hypothetical protein